MPYVFCVCVVLWWIILERIRVKPETEIADKQADSNKEGGQATK